MDRSVLSDRKLLALGLVALVAGAGTVFAVGGDLAVLSTNTHGAPSVDDGACSGASISGRALEARRDDGRASTSGAWAERTVVYTLGQLSLDAGRIVACTGVGDIDVETGSSSEAVVVFHIKARGPEARHVVEDAEVQAQFRERGGGLQLLAQDLTEHRHDETDWSVSIAIEVPDKGAYEVLATSGVGDVSVEGLHVDRAEVHSGVGDIELIDVHTEDDLRLVTGVGDIELDAHPLRSGRWLLDTGTGDMDLTLFGDRAIGYDVTASTNVGSVDIDLGRTESHERRTGNGPSDEEQARTAGYAAKAVQVVLHADAGVGDIDVDVD